MLATESYATINSNYVKNNNIKMFMINGKYKQILYTKMLSMTSS